MKAVKNINLQWIKGLMLASQVLLMVFTAQWLYSQYKNQKEELKQDLAKLFTDVQHQVSDSLLLTNIIDPVTGRAGVVTADSSFHDVTTLSPQGLHRILTKNAGITGMQEKSLFKMDTIVFNELFTNEMKQNGWNFNAQWINNNDSEKDGRCIFIKSNFFTHENGVVIKNYRSYLLWGMLPQFLFVLILISLSAAAFYITYRSLQSQIRLSLLKDDFISNMSHELKTPIATVKVALEALNNYHAIDNPEMTREYLGMMTAEMDRLELMATRVLNTSLLESGKVYLQKESYDLKQLVTGVLQSMQPRFDKAGARITFEASGKGFTVPVDKLHMQGVLVNLLDNSLKYAIAPARIRIALAENNGKVSLAFTDNGPGIPEEYREKIFEKFFRVPNGNKHNTKGYGLGLSYAAQVMRQHNGSINVNNIASGGCVFTLTF